MERFFNRPAKTPEQKKEELKTAAMVAAAGVALGGAGMQTLEQIDLQKKRVENAATAAGPQHAMETAALSSTDAPPAVTVKLATTEQQTIAVGPEPMTIPDPTPEQVNIDSPIR